MKKLILFLFLLSSTLYGTAEEHLTFKGIPIEGSLTKFCKQLTEKGFIQANRGKNCIVFVGDFTGRTATVQVIATDNGQDVYSVTVLFNASDTWNSLVSEYAYYKDLYTEKYGMPIECIETNSSYDSNTAQMFNLVQGRVSYYSVFKTIGGRIRVSIEKGGVESASYMGYLQIRYHDEQNIQTKRSNDLEEI